GEVARGRFRGERGEPAWRVTERGGQGQPGPARRAALRGGGGGLGVAQVAGRIRDAGDLHRRIEQLLEGERRVQRGVPGGDAAGQHAAHGQRGAEPARVALVQASGDD